MNLNNSEQVAYHLRRLIMNERQLNNVLQILSEKRNSAIGRFTGIVEFHDGVMTVPYFNLYAKEKDKKTLWGFPRAIEAQIAYAMRDYDAPFSCDEVQDFCKFFDLDPAPMLREAVTNDQDGPYKKIAEGKWEKVHANQDQARNKEANEVQSEDEKDEEMYRIIDNFERKVFKHKLNMSIANKESMRSKGFTSLSKVKLSKEEKEAFKRYRKQSEEFWDSNMIAIYVKRKTKEENKGDK